MAFKNYVPSAPSASWADYWKKLKVGDDLVNCQSDGLLPIFQKFLTKKQQILEAGCGLGKWVIYLTKLGYDIEGVDNYAPGIKKIKTYDHKLKARVGDVEKLPYKDESFDTYLSFGVVEHWEDGPKRPLAEAFRVVRKGGICIVETPADSPLRQLLRFVSESVRIVKLPLKVMIESLGMRQKRQGIKTKFYEYHYLPSELASYVKNVGFEIIGMYPKDDLDPCRSIGLWLDFPKLREIGKPDFTLTSLGQLVKRIFLPFPWIWSCCVVVVGQKPL